MTTGYFNNSGNPLSNEFSFRFLLDGQRFSTVDGAYQYERALHHESAGRSESTPLRHEEEEGWVHKKASYMYCLLIQKYKQCPAYRSVLTRYADFVSDTSDEFWGRGKNSKGANVLGKLHSRVQRFAKSILIVGSCAAKHMDLTLMELLSTRAVHVDSICHSRAKIADLLVAVKGRDLSQYDVIVVAAGENDIQDKNSKIRKEPDQVALDLQQLADCAKSRSGSCITVISNLIPKYHHSNCVNSSDLNCAGRPCGRDMRRTVDSYNQFAQQVNNQLPSSMRCTSLWTESRPFLDGNNHLTSEGRRMLARSWMRHCVKFNFVFHNHQE